VASDLDLVIVSQVARTIIDLEARGNMGAYWANVASIRAVDLAALTPAQ
jgi:hypothetical protein